MTPLELFDSIYLGDRVCTHIEMGLAHSCVRMGFNSIVKKDVNHLVPDIEIERGVLVFDGVSSFGIEPFGSIPNDFVGDWRAEQLAPSENAETAVPAYRFQLWIDCIKPPSPRPVNARVEIVAGSVRLEGK
jgi:hypothetical protein